MPVNPNNPTVIFLRALHDQAPTDDQLAALDPDWQGLVQAAINATPVNRRAAAVLIKSGQSDTDRLLGLLRGNPAPEDRPWSAPTPFGEPPLPRFPEEVLPTWLTIYIRSEARATQVPTDLVAMLALAVLSTALAGPIVLNPWGDWLEPLNLFTMVVLPPGHRKSAIFGNVTAPLHQFETDAARNAAPLLALPTAALGRRVANPEPMDPSLRRMYHHHVNALLALTHSTPPPSAPACPSHSPASSEHPADRSRLSLSIAMGRDVDAVDVRAAQRARGGAVLPFDPFAADRLTEFAEAIEPRLAPDGDLDPIVDWASKLVGATARIAGLIHLASLDLPQNLVPVRPGAVDAAIVIAEYLIEHARAAYAAMGLDPTIANVPTLLAWIKRTGRDSFSRRDARHAVRSRIRSDADLDDALADLEHHGYIRLRPHQRRPGQGRPASPTYDVHPSLVRR